MSLIFIRIQSFRNVIYIYKRGEFHIILLHTIKPLLWTKWKWWT